MTSLWIAGVGGIGAALSLWGLRRARRSQAIFWRIGGSVTAIVIGLVAISLLIVGSVGYWYFHRPLPDPIAHEPLFEGVTYTRLVRHTPRPLVIHVVRVDLTTPGLAFLVTPSDPVQDANGTFYPLRARKTSQFLEEHDLQLAINGGFFTPWWSNSPWDYYPHVGDPVQPSGFASSRGHIYSPNHELYPILYITEDNQVSINIPPDDVYNALAGNARLLDAGTVPTFSNNTYYDALHPRTAVGMNREKDTLILVVVDGRQPNYSEGVTVIELAVLMRALGAFDAINLDGGGSSTLVIERPSGESDILNSPIDNWIPGRERPVANHLGLWAPDLPD